MDKHERTTVAVHKDLWKELKSYSEEEGMKLERYVERIIRAGIKVSRPTQES